MEADDGILESTPLYEMSKGILKIRGYEMNAVEVQEQTRDSEQAVQGLGDYLSVSPP